jgi:hypothetical protein
MTLKFSRFYSDRPTTLHTGHHPTTMSQSMVLKMSFIFNCFFNGTCSLIHDTLLILILGSYIVILCILCSCQLLGERGVMLPF